MPRSTTMAVPSGRGAGPSSSPAIPPTADVAAAHSASGVSDPARAPAVTAASSSFGPSSGRSSRPVSTPFVQIRVFKSSSWTMASARVKSSAISSMAALDVVLAIAGSNSARS